MKNVFFSLLTIGLLYNCKSKKSTTTHIKKSGDTTQIHSDFFKNDRIAYHKCKCKITKIDSLENIYVFYSALEGNNIKILVNKEKALKNKVIIGKLYNLKLKPLTDIGIQIHGLKGINFEGIFIKSNENRRSYKIYTIY